jgi:capsular polysaccharide biosynthesis protein
MAQTGLYGYWLKLPVGVLHHERKDLKRIQTRQEMKGKERIDINGCWVKLAIGVLVITRI